MGFSAETFSFLRDLEANNSKEWFDANRTRYEEHWKAAALDFIADVSGAMGALNPSLCAEPKLNKSLRRINRDVRFSKDKSPYNARLHMVFWSGDHPNRSPGLHVVLSSGGVGYGAGWFGLTPAELAAVRKRIAGKDGPGLIDAVALAETVHCQMGAPDLARVPRGFEADGEVARLLRYKSIVARTYDHLDPPEAVFGKTGADWLSDKSKALMPLLRWLAG